MAKQQQEMRNKSQLNDLINLRDIKLLQIKKSEEYHRIKLKEVEDILLKISKLNSGDTLPLIKKSEVQKDLVFDY